MSGRNGLSRRQFIRLVGGATATLGAGRTLPFPSRADAVQGAGGAPIVLAYNENAFGMFPAAREAIVAAASHGNRYPKEMADGLREAVAQSVGVEPDMILLGAGSIEPLKIITELFCAPGRGPVVAEPTFEAVVTYAGLSKIEPIKVPLGADHRLDLDRMLAAATGAGLVYVCNPNNPTASIVDKDALRTFLDRVPAGVPVMIDEAYHEWVDNPRYESSIRHVKDGRPVMVLRTFSKVYGLAGLRVGYAVAAKDTVKRLEPHRLANTLNTAGIAAARASLADPASAMRVRQRNARIRDSFVAWVRQQGYAPIPSDANFLMMDVRRPVPQVIEALKQHGFLVGRLFPSMPTHLRISLGTEEEMEQFKPALQTVLQG